MDYLQCNSGNYTSGRSSGIDHIVMHYTASNASAYNNCSYFANNSDCNASAHYFVDDGGVWQSVAEGDTAWHCGEWGMNTRSIGIEVCTDGLYSDAEIAHAADLIADIRSRYNIPDENIIRHYDVTGKHCPAAYVDEGMWAELKSRLLEGDDMPSAQEVADAVWRYELRGANGYRKDAGQRMCNIDDKTQTASTALTRTDDAGSGYKTGCDEFTHTVWNAKRLSALEKKVDQILDLLAKK